jgi:hypothetical protein
MQRPRKRGSAPRFRWTRLGQALFSAPKDALSLGKHMLGRSTFLVSTGVSAAAVPENYARDFNHC